MKIKAKDQRSNHPRSSWGEIQKAGVQRAPRTDAGRVSLDLPPGEEISRPEICRAPDVAGGRRIGGRTEENAAEQRALGKEKIFRGRLKKRGSRSEGTLRLREEG